MAWIDQLAASVTTFVATSGPAPLTWEAHQEDEDLWVLSFHPSLVERNGEKMWAFLEDIDVTAMEGIFDHGALVTASSNHIGFEGEFSGFEVLVYIHFGPLEEGQPIGRIEGSAFFPFEPGPAQVLN